MALDAHDIWSEAATCYRRAIDLDPKDARWPFHLAGLLNRGGSRADKEEAVRLYRQAADLPGPSSAHWATALLTLADLLTELGRGKEAVPLYELVNSADPTNPWAAYRIGMIWAERDETEKAAQILLGLARNPYAQKKSAIAMAELSRRAGKAKDADGFDYAAGLLPPDHEWANPFAVEIAALWRGRRAADAALRRSRRRPTRRRRPSTPRPRWPTSTRRSKPNCCSCVPTSTPKTTRPPWPWPTTFCGTRRGRSWRLPTRSSAWRGSGWPTGQRRGDERPTPTGYLSRRPRRSGSRSGSSRTTSRDLSIGRRHCSGSAGFRKPRRPRGRW